MSVVRSISRPAAVGGPVGIGVVMALLLLVVGLGLRLPSLGVFDDIGEEAPGYDTIRGEPFSPLRDAFVQRVLGTTAAGTDATVVDAPRSAGLQPPARVLEHSLTNDAFADAIVVRDVPFTAITNTGGATRESQDPRSCAATGGTVWYRFRPDRNIRLSANTFGTGHAVAVAVFTGTSVSDLRSAGCDSDVSGAAQVVFPAAAGRTYAIQITGIVAGGRLVFNLMPRGSTILASEVGGAPGNGDSGSGRQYTSNNVMSADGTHVAFPSFANNFVAGDTNGRIDAFVREIRSGKIARASVTSSGAEWKDDGSPAPRSDGPPPGTIQQAITSLSISADGGVVAFQSFANDLVAGDTNGEAGPTQLLGGGEDVFVRDLRTGETTRVSVTSDGRQGTRRTAGTPHYRTGRIGCCSGTAISADGRFVAFTSYWEDLVPGDTNENPDVFVHDRKTGRTTLVSVDARGEQFFGASQPFISANGRYVGFSSGQVYVHDRATGVTSRASFGRGGRTPNHMSSHGSISDDGRFVAFQSAATDIVRGDTNDLVDAFVADLRTKSVRRVSVDSSGRQHRAPSGSNENRAANYAPSMDPTPQISGDGRSVVFQSPAANLVAGDTNNFLDVFVHNIDTGRTQRVSVSTSGSQGNNLSADGRLSRDGRFVVFSSLSSNFAPGDDNGASDVFVREVSDE